MKDRLTLFMQSEGLTAYRLAEIIDVQPSAISHILSERNKPGYDFLFKLFSAFPKLNPSWLILGSGEMYLDKKENKPTTSSDTGDHNYRNNAQKSLSVGKFDNSDNSEKSDKCKIEKIIIFYDNNTFESYTKT